MKNADAIFQIVGCIIAAIGAFLYALFAKTWVALILFAGVGVGMSVYANILISEYKRAREIERQQDNF